jgi:hypothetical protein
MPASIMSLMSTCAAPTVSPFFQKGYYTLISLDCPLCAEPVPLTNICSQKLTPADAAEFSSAIAQRYWYELFVDDLPVWGFVGDIKGEASTTKQHMVIFTHKQFNISYNGDRVRGHRQQQQMQEQQQKQEQE